MFKIKYTRVVESIAGSNMSFGEETEISYETYIEGQLKGYITLEDGSILFYEDFTIEEVDAENILNELKLSFDDEDFDYVPYKGHFYKHMEGNGFFAVTDIKPVRNVYIGKDGSVNENCAKSWHKSPVEAMSAIRKRIEKGE